MTRKRYQQFSAEVLEEGIRKEMEGSVFPAHAKHW